MVARLTRQRIAGALRRLLPAGQSLRIDRAMLHASLANCEDELRDMQAVFERVQARQTSRRDAFPMPRLPTCWRTSQSKTR